MVANPSAVHAGAGHWTFTEMRPQDLRQVLAIERSSFANPWSSALFLQELRIPFSRILVVRPAGGADEPIVGYLCRWFVADEIHVLNVAVHLAHRDVTFIAVSKARLEQLEAFKKRMGWSFKWVSGFGNDFGRDYHVSFTPEEMERKQMFYNYRMVSFPREEAVGVSVFYKNDRGELFHTYSCYSRGVDMVNGTYHYLDLTPKGRDEAGLSFTQAWVRHHDKYDEPA